MAARTVHELLDEHLGLLVFEVDRLGDEELPLAIVQRLDHLDYRTLCIPFSSLNLSCIEK